jgi:glycosyltransferase involved in cell wall biosynthesis
VLFSGAFDNPVKNPTLAQETIGRMPEVTLLELKGYSRPQVAILMQAVDVLLMTSFTEGSPQVIKEALACGCPIVSVDVGDVAERVAGVDGCYIAMSDVPSLTDALNRAITFGKRTRGRDVILHEGLSNDRIASRLIDIYHACLS